MQFEENYKVVPWFSREEWKEVYESIFSNSAERWEFAFYKLLVWKARRPNLHIGIESTIPVLLAQMAFSDPTLCFPFKNVIIDWAISRFVTITMKGHHAPGMTMRNIAPKINMPIYLIDFRNETNHDDSKFASTLLLQTALNDSLSFIKSSYWDDEEAACSKELKCPTFDSDDKTNEIETNVSDNDSEKENNVFNELIKNIIKFNKLTFKNAKLATFQVKGSSVDDLDIRAVTKQVKIVCESFSRYLLKNPSKCMETLVKQLFYSNSMKKCIQKNVLHKNKKCKKCIIMIPPQILFLFSPIIGLILKSEVLDLLFETLLSNFEALDCSSLCTQWLRTLLNTFFPIKKGGCIYHKFKKGIIISHLASVNWKVLLFQLFSIDQSWSLTLALQLSQSLSIDGDKISQLCELHSLYVTSKEPTGDATSLQIEEEKIDSYLSPDNIRDLDNLLTEALKVSTDVHGYVEELGKCLPLNNSRSSGKRITKCSEFAPLGLLPHQIDDSSFFQKLKLTDNFAKPSLWSHCK